MGSATSPGVYQEPTTSGKAIASLICAIVGFVFLGVVLGPVAICLGVSAKTDIEERNGQVKGECLATAGIIMGVIGFVLSIVLIIVVVSG
jgi:hypothetical protein